MLRYALTRSTKRGEIGSSNHIFGFGDIMTIGWIKRTTMTLTLSCIASLAWAQYVWLNSKGDKEYSDMPPPLSVPQHRILKEPNRTTNLTNTTERQSDGKDTSPSNDVAASKPKLPPTIAEKNADFQKRKLEQAEKEKLATDKAKAEADKAKNCERARAYQRNLSGGIPITSTDKNGERYYLNEAQIDQERRENKRTLEDCK